MATLAERLAAYPSDWSEIADDDRSTPSRLPRDDLDELSVA